MGVSREEGRGRHSCNNRSWDWAVFGGASRPVLSMCGVVWCGVAMSRTHTGTSKSGMRGLRWKPRTPDKRRTGTRDSAPHLVKRTLAARANIFTVDRLNEIATQGLDFARSVCLIGDGFGAMFPGKLHAVHSGKHHL